MKLVSVAPEDAVSAILAHSHRGDKTKLKKGHVLSETDCRLLLDDGVSKVVVAQLEEGDVAEDQAAELLSNTLASDLISAEAPFTGRANLYARQTGLFLADREVIARLNRVDPAITIATLNGQTFVERGRMVGTVKIIPFAVDGATLQKVIEIANAERAIDLKEAKPLRVGLVATKLPSLKHSTMDKTRKVLADRLVPSGGNVSAELRVSHTVEAVVDALSALKATVDLIIVFGASAISDRADVIPAGLEAAGGTVVHLGMPVDPGNLLMIGKLAETPVIGAPGCARSPAENGFDWVLNRMLCGLPVDGEYLTGLGVGGLLMEISTRTQPREG